MKFGSREICNVVFKALSEGQQVGKKSFKKYQPVFMIDTAKTSTIEQATSSVYATGGSGNTRLIAWEGEKTVTYTVEDALMSPQGLAVLSGAGITEASDSDAKHFHVVMNGAISNIAASGTAEYGVKFTLDELNAELGTSLETIYVCKNTSVPVYGTVLDGSGAGIDFIDGITVGGTAASDTSLIAVTEDNPVKFTVTDSTLSGKTIAFDFYVAMNAGVTQISIRPESFGGYFYVEADTLYRREDSGKDMAAAITFPKVKIQSGFTIAMNATGDPSTFSFVMDAMPAFTRFDRTHKTVCEIQIVGTDASGSGDTEAEHTHSFSEG